MFPVPLTNPLPLSVFPAQMDAEACLRVLVESARSGRGSGEGGAVLDGVFRKMLDPAEFQRLVYPGLSPAQRASAPPSLQAILCDRAHATAVQLLVPQARDRAQRVLDAVKKRGAADGDYMDARTEAELWPGVFQEAFARELMAMVAATTAAAHAEAVRRETVSGFLWHVTRCYIMVFSHVLHRAVLVFPRQASTVGTLASPAAPMAQWSQLTPEALAGLMSASTKHGIVHGFADSAWSLLYSSDADRLWTAGRMTSQTAPVAVAKGHSATQVRCRLVLHVLAPLSSGFVALHCAHWHTYKDIAPTAHRLCSHACGGVAGRGH